MPVEPTTWCYALDLEDSNGASDGITDTGDGNTFEWIPDEGLKGNVPDNGDRLFARLNVPGGPVEITNAAFEWTLVGPAEPGNWWLGNDGYGSPTALAPDQTSANRDFNTNVSYFVLGFERPGSNFAEIGRINRVILTGPGAVSPWGPSNC